ncbi:hypothetical protein EDD18DRAFT_1167283 [Armillaria luteobubalina]|uniref:Uncharacterized protein n=1 Tax=Armillaria luteobubalina TaxID=153913 RepID=A0AA39UX47_9AGAR|nr:hypothetical protein EDD18DRAFT_1167283 [Armillaria luteobubalina]
MDDASEHPKNYGTNCPDSKERNQRYLGTSMSLCDAMQGDEHVYYSRPAGAPAPSYQRCDPPFWVLHVCGHARGYEGFCRAILCEDGEAKQRIPLALVDSASASIPRLLLGIGERDVPFLYPAREKFNEALKTKGLSCDEFVVNGHNHVSLVFTLGPGQGEEWAESVIK